MTFDVESFEALPIDAIRKTVREHRIARVRGLFDREAIRGIYRTIAARFDLVIGAVLMASSSSITMVPVAS